MSHGSTTVRVSLVDRDGAPIATDMVNGQIQLVVDAPAVERLLCDLIQLQKQVLEQLKKGG